MPWTSTSEGIRLYTIGHSTRTLQEVSSLLRQFGIEQLVDVRHFPRSRRNPHFNRELLEREMPEAGIVYVQMGQELGGFRKGGYQAYMDTVAFQSGLSRLTELARANPTAIMCAEIVWFRCHRRFIARRMAASGFTVLHIVDSRKRLYEEGLPPDTDRP